MNKIKSLFCTMAIVMMLAMAACSKPSPAQQAIDLVESTTKQVQAAASLEELNTLQADFQKKFDAIDAPDDYEPSAEEETKLQEALKAYLQAYIVRIGELSDNSQPLPSQCPAGADCTDCSQKSECAESSACPDGSDCAGCSK